MGVLTDLFAIDPDGLIDDDAMLAKRLAAGDVRPEEMEALADLLGDFYGRAESTDEIRAFGDEPVVRPGPSGGGAPERRMGASTESKKDSAADLTATQAARLAASS